MQDTSKEGQFKEPKSQNNDPEIAIDESATLIQEIEPELKRLIAQIIAEDQEGN